MTDRRRSTAASLLVLLAVVPFVIYGVPGVIGADHSFVVLSGSMEPAISTGDVVIVDGTDPAAIESGDVITFTRSGGETVVTHRVVGVHEAGGELAFETRGDANDAIDRTPVLAEDVVGVVVLTLPLVGYVVGFVHTPLGFAALVVLPLGLLVANEVWSFARSANDGTPGSDPEPAVDAGGDGSSTGGAVGTDDVADAQSLDASSSGAHAPDRPAIEAGEAWVAIDVRDLTLTCGILLSLTPYTVYVALQLQTVLAITIAYAVGIAALVLSGLRVREWSAGRIGEQAGGLAGRLSGGFAGRLPDGFAGKLPGGLASRLVGGRTDQSRRSVPPTSGAEAGHDGRAADGGEPVDLFADVDRLDVLWAADDEEGAR